MIQLLELLKKIVFWENTEYKDVLEFLLNFYIHNKKSEKPPSFNEILKIMKNIMMKKFQKNNFADLIVINYLKNNTEKEDLTNILEIIEILCKN